MTTTRTKPRKYTVVIDGNTTAYYGTFRVALADGKGGVIFGTNADANLSADWNDGNKVEAEVAISGIGSHSTALGRQRAAVYLRACDIAEAFLDEAKQHKGSKSVLCEAFTAVAESLGLEVVTFTDESTGLIQAVRAEQREGGWEA